MSPSKQQPAPDNPLQELYSQLASWVAELLEGREPVRVDSQKLVRDAVHGYYLLDKHEVSVIDSPLLQRLRHIHQTAFAYLIYPTAHHTRFDHTLGVAAIAERMVSSLVQVRGAKVISAPMIREVRLAALLHDVGHTFFSHLSESIIRERYKDWFRRIKRMEFRGRERFFHKAQPGEILSYVIVTCEPGRTFLRQALDMNGAADIDLDTVAGLIVGQPPHDTLAFLADIINGPMDADKIDYLLRDCHFSGIRAEVDPERIYYTLDIIDLPGWPNYLTVQAGGVPHLEQMLFAKMMLYTSIYHHHKIRTLECMMKSLFETIVEGGIKDKRLRFESIADFFRVTEHDWFTLGLQEDKLRAAVADILNRRLLKRALVISRKTVEEPTLADLPDFEKLPLKGAQEVREVREEIHDSLPRRWQKGVDKLWVDVPYPGPDIDEAANHCWVMIGKEPEPLSKTFPTADWLRTYEANKLRSHVFYVADVEARKMAAGAAKRVLKKRYGLEFNELATLWCKLG